MIKKAFKYIENLWLGVDGKVSLRASLAIAFSIDFISNLSHAIYKWDAGRTLEGLSLVLGIEAGLIFGLLGITAYANATAQKIESQAANPPPAPIVVNKAENVTSTGPTKAETVNTQNIETVNTQNTNNADNSPINTRKD